MPTVEVYTKDYCPYCVRAINLLRLKKIDFKEIDITHDPLQAEIMLARSGGRRTVPQIFINNQAIGGCDDLHKLDAEGVLEGLLKDG